MTLYILESGITKASEVTREFFKRVPFFFVKDNKDTTFSFINPCFPDDKVTTSSAVVTNSADNGYMRIATQNSIICITPFVIGCKILQTYQVEEMIDYCSFVKTEDVPYKTFYLNNRMIVEGSDDLTFISKDSSSGFAIVDEIEGWTDQEIRLFKDTKGYLYLEYVFDFEGEKTNKHTHSFKKTNIKIG